MFPRANVDAALVEYFLRVGALHLIDVGNGKNIVHDDLDVAMMTTSGKGLHKFQLIRFLLSHGYINYYASS